MTCFELVKKGALILDRAGIENALTEAEILLLFLLECSKTEYILNRAQEADEKTESAYLKLINRRTGHEPLQYITGNAPFLGMDFSVGEGVLIPRPETEELTQICIDRIRNKGYRTVIDLCSGSGCIGISIASQCLQTEVWLLEKSENAIAYIKKNVPEGISSRVHPVLADILTCALSVAPAPDLIVSNPPYIASDEIGALQTEVQMEPHIALDGGEDGLLFYRNIASRWASGIRSGGMLALECGETQTDYVMHLLQSATNKEAFCDMFGLKRFVIAEY